MLFSRLNINIFRFAAAVVFPFMAAGNVFGSDVRDVNLAVQALQSEVTGKLSISKKRKSPYLSFVRTNKGSVISDVSVSRRPSDRAVNFLQHRKTLFVANNTPLDLTARDIQTSHGYHFVRLQQRFKGLAVRGGEAVVQMNDAGVVAVNSRLVSAVQSVDTTPTVAAGQALAAARSRVLELYGITQAGFSEPVLEIFNESALKGNDGPSLLAWFIEATGPMVREYIWVDARTASVITSVSQIARAHDKQRNTFDAQNVVCNVDSTVLERTEVSGPAAVTEVNVAHDLAGTVYDFYLNTLGRHGLLDDPVAINSIISIVNVCPTLSPAFDQPAGINLELAAWNGVQMLYATGYAVDDLVGHEYTHAVIDKSAAFMLTGESGALAESFADVIGETIDLDVDQSSDVGDVRWDIGEDTGTTFRNLMNPQLSGMPVKMSDITYCGPDDDVFIHTNSSVLSHAFALLADGGTFNSVSITGITATRAAIIFYEALKLLTSTSQFADASNALRSTAATLEGAGTITAAEELALNNALDAVEMDVASPCRDQQIAYCPVGQAPQFLFFDDFNNPSSGNWSSSVDSGVTDHWDWNRNVSSVGIYSDLQPRSGVYSLYANTSFNGEQGGATVAMNNVITLPSSGSDIRMQFEHNYQFDTNLTHGGVVEYKVGNGAWQTDAGTLMTQGGYNGVVMPGLSPLQGRDAFVEYQFDDGATPVPGPLNTYGSTQMDLSSFSDQGIQFRFRVGIDNFSNERGWLIDDFAIYTCETQIFVLSDVTGLTTNEAGQVAQFDISLASQPPGAVSIGIDVSDVSEGISDTTTHTFTTTNWNVPKTITITGRDDTLTDGDQTYTVTVSITSAPAGSIYEGVSDIVVQLTNVDDDSNVAPTGGGGGGCSLSTRAPFDPGLPLLLFFSLAYLALTKKKRSVLFKPSCAS